MAHEHDVVIRACDCAHEYQDKVYGAGMRVHNPKKTAQGSRPRTTCTVCGKVKEPS